MVVFSQATTVVSEIGIQSTGIGFMYSLTVEARVWHQVDIGASTIY